MREIAAVLDLSWVHAELAPYYPSIGRPSIDPVLMIRMLIVGYVFAIRSERLLCREVQVNLAYRWFCGLSIEDKIPDHSAFSRARNESFRNSDIFRRVFERVVEACIAMGLVGGEGFAVDASLIAADANKQRSIPGKDWDKKRDPQTASRAVREYLATLDDTAFGAASDVTPKFVSPSDPAAQWTGAMRGPAFFAYADNVHPRVHLLNDGRERVDLLLQGLLGHWGSIACWYHCNFLHARAAPQNAIVCSRTKGERHEAAGVDHIARRRCRGRVLVIGGARTNAEQAPTDRMARIRYNRRCRNVGRVSS